MALMSGKQLNIFGDEAVLTIRKQLGICENCNKPVYDDEIYCNPESTIYFHGPEMVCVK